jgi:hypothetical protein
MPYIKDEDKEKFDNGIEQIAAFINAKGDLNYVICELVGRLITRDGIGYTTISNWLDGVHGAEVELRRRILDRYEDYKIIGNGDVPSFKTVLELMKRQEEE